MLALGLRSAIRGSIRGRIVWLGALAYMSYMWASIGLQVGFNQFFLGYVVLFGLSLFTFVGGMVPIETGAIDRSFRTTSRSASTVGSWWRSRSGWRLYGSRSSCPRR